jgi:hypothetical protein
MGKDDPHDRASMHLEVVKLLVEAGAQIYMLDKVMDDE